MRTQSRPNVHKLMHPATSLKGGGAPLGGRKQPAAAGHILGGGERVGAAGAKGRDPAPPWRITPPSVRQAGSASGPRAVGGITGAVYYFTCYHSGPHPTDAPQLLKKKCY